MPDRITAADADRMASRYGRACARLGLISPGARIILTHGSRTNGIAWRVHTVPAGSSGHQRPPAGDDFLGWTAREAMEVLADRARTLEDVAYALRVDRLTAVDNHDRADTAGIVLTYDGPGSRAAAIDTARRMLDDADATRPGRVCPSCRVAGPAPRHCDVCDVDVPA